MYKVNYMEENGILKITVTQINTRKFFPPVGTEEERLATKLWPGKWVDANGYCRWYYSGSSWAWHTGADLNLNSPTFDADAHAPVYAIADGTIYAIRQFAGWDWVLCIDHKEVLSRYAHIENILVHEGQEVTAGTQLASIGNAGGNYPYHLHFDITYVTARMRQYPGDWPKEDKTRVLNDYINPLDFLREHVND